MSVYELNNISLKGLLGETILKAFIEETNNNKIIITLHSTRGKIIKFIIESSLPVFGKLEINKRG